MKTKLTKKRYRKQIKELQQMKRIVNKEISTGRYYKKGSNIKRAYVNSLNNEIEGIKERFIANIPLKYLKKKFDFNIDDNLYSLYEGKGKKFNVIVMDGKNFDNLPNRIIKIIYSNEETKKYINNGDWKICTE